MNYSIDDQALGRRFPGAAIYNNPEYGPSWSVPSSGIRLYSWGSGCGIWQLNEDGNYSYDSNCGYYVNSLKIAHYIKAKGRRDMSTIASVRADRTNIDGTPNAIATDIAFNYNRFRPLIE